MVGVVVKNKLVELKGEFSALKRVVVARHKCYRHIQIIRLY